MRQRRVASTDGGAEYGPDRSERSMTNRSQIKESLKYDKKNNNFLTVQASVTNTAVYLPNKYAASNLPI